MIDWSRFNRSTPDFRKLFSSSIGSYQDYTVIDFGSGLNPSQHLPIKAAAICRIDIHGVVASDFAAVGLGLDDVLELINGNQKTTFVAFRVFSVLEPDYLAILLDKLRNRVHHVVVCDYAYSPHRGSEYMEIETMLGPTATVGVDWSIGRFCHYKPSQIIDRLNMQVVEVRDVVIPSVSKDTDHGMLLKFQA